MKISGTKKRTLKTSMCVAAYTTAHARIWLHKLIMSIVSQGGKIYYCDTDSVIFEGATIESGDALGEAGNELDEGDYIVTLVSVGAKAYTYRTNNGKQTVKLKGAPEKCRQEMYEKMIQIVRGELAEVRVNTGVTFRVDNLHEMCTRDTHKKATKTLNKQHFIEDGSSRPFGHRLTM